MDYTEIPIDRRNLERIIVRHPAKSVITINMRWGKEETLIDRGIFTKMPSAIKDGRRVDTLDDKQIGLNEFNSSPMLKMIGWGWMAISLFIMLFFKSRV